MVIRRMRPGRSERSAAFRYARWDGTQSIAALDADALLEQLGDDLLANPDPLAALRRMMQQGFEGPNGDVQGLRDLLRSLQERRQEILQENRLGGITDEIRDALDEVVSTERAALAEAPDGDLATQRFQLDMLPDDLAGQVRELQNYDFVSAEAEERFEEILDELREQVTGGLVDQMREQMGNLTDDDRRRMADMMAALNELLERRLAGEDPDIGPFLDEFGDFFAGEPSTLDELLEQIAQRMAAMSSLMASMSPEDRAELQALSQELLADLDLGWQFSQLNENLRALFPQMNWDQSADFSGVDPLNLPGALGAFEQLGQIDAMRSVLASAGSPGALAEIDIEELREVLGDEAADSLAALSRVAEALERAGLVENRGGELKLTPRAIRRIGQQALADLFARLDEARLGGHETSLAGPGHDREYTTRQWEWGDPFNLHIERTVANAVRRRATEGAIGPIGEGRQGDGGVGDRRVYLRPEDFEVERTERLVRSATVLMLDLSWSMILREHFQGAKKVALALETLISSRYPRDYLGLVGFGLYARELSFGDIATIDCDWQSGTNMHQGFGLARRLLASEAGSKQIIMITDGEPTAHLDDFGEAHFQYPPSRETVVKTIQEVKRCTQADIRINTFMLDATDYLVDFMNRLSEINGGRSFIVDDANLGDYVLSDYLTFRQMRRWAA